MKDSLLQMVADAPVEQRRNLGREYLQIYLLRLLHVAGVHDRLAFVGGTALRLLHRLPRYSEDLDFVLSAGGAPAPGLDVDRLFRRLRGELERAGYQVAAKQKTDRTVANVLFRFVGLPREMGWSRDPRVGLSVKLEIDLRPPAGAVLETTLVQRFFPVALRHHDLASLFAGKLHAVLARPYTKGRDWFDLAWYLTEKRGLQPNLTLLQKALAQTGHTLRASRWRADTAARLNALDWGEVLADLRPFVERQSDLEHLSPELLAKALRE
jgi:hypothetical protein